MQGKERGLFLSREGCEGKAHWLCRLFGQRKKLCLVLLCVIMNHALREGPTRDLGVSRAGRSLPGLRGSPALCGGCSGGMLRPPRYAGTKQAGRGSVAVLRGAQVIPSGLPRTCPFSRAASLRACLLCHLHPRPPGPCPAPRGATGMRHRLALPRGSSVPAVARLLQEHRVFTVAGAVFRGRSCPRVGAPGSARLLPCGKKGSSRSHRVQRLERLRRLGGGSCRDRSVGLTRGLKSTDAGNFGPVPACPRAARVPKRLPGAVWLSGRSWCRSAAPHPLSPSRFSAEPPRTHPSLLLRTQCPECCE